MTEVLEIAKSRHLPSRTECTIDRSLSRKSPLLPAAYTYQRFHVSVEREGGHIQRFVAVPAPDFHPSGFDMTVGFVLAPERCITAGAIPPPLQSAFDCSTALTGRRGNDLMPSGVYRIRLRSLGTECQGLLLRHGHKRAAHVSDISRGDVRGNLAWDVVESWGRHLLAFFSGTLLERRTRAWRRPRPKWTVRPGHTR